MAPVNDERRRGVKHNKVYVENQDAALKLARSVMENQESKKGAAAKSRTSDKQNSRIDRKTRTSAKEKLVQTKAMVKAQLKEKTKTRKDASRSDSTKGQQTSSVSVEPVISTRKRVTFA